jgi:hypothetical protein
MPFLTQLTAALRPFFTDAAGRVLLLITASPDVADAAQTSQVRTKGIEHTDLVRWYHWEQSYLA